MKARQEDSGERQETAQRCVVFFHVASFCNSYVITVSYQHAQTTALLKHMKTVSFVCQPAPKILILQNLVVLANILGYPVLECGAIQKCAKLHQQELRERILITEWPNTTVPHMSAEHI